MDTDFGDSFITITDEDGIEYELEVLDIVDYREKQYYAVVPAAAADDEDEELEISILRSDEEDGEPIFSAITDEDELESVYSLLIDRLYDEEDDEDE